VEEEYEQLIFIENKALRSKWRGKRDKEEGPVRRSSLGQGEMYNEGDEETKLTG